MILPPWPPVWRARPSYGRRASSRRTRNPVGLSHAFAESRRSVWRVAGDARTWNHVRKSRRQISSRRQDACIAALGVAPVDLLRTEVQRSPAQRVGTLL